MRCRDGVERGPPFTVMEGLGLKMLLSTNEDISRRHGFVAAPEIPEGLVLSKNILVFGIRPLKESQHDSFGILGSRTGLRDLDGKNIKFTLPIQYFVNTKKYGTLL